MRVAEAPVVTVVQFSNTDIDRFVVNRRNILETASVRAAAAFNYRRHPLVFMAYKQDLLEKL